LEKQVESYQFGAGIALGDTKRQSGDTKGNTGGKDGTHRRTASRGKSGLNGTKRNSSPSPKRGTLSLTGTLGASKQISDAKAMSKRPGDAALPDADRTNPFLNRTFPRALADRFVLRKTFRGHRLAISALALHPTKAIVATVSDDRTWKLWSIPNGELIMSGDGHKDWVASCEFHPRGTLLATGSGDSTVKIWDLMNARCAATFTDHKQAVWDVSWHDTGDFCVSASMDHTARLWDLVSGRCRQTFRGHADSVNAVGFQPYTNTLCTGSGDKTVSLWDVRSGLCVQTFVSHKNAVLHVAFHPRGDQLASTDADGKVKVWDVRKLEERLSISTTGAERHPTHGVCWDSSGQVLAVASYDGTVKIFNSADGVEAASLAGHEDSVQAVVFDPDGKFLVSAASDATFRIWS